jgi:seryl-tRNA synthetase
MIDINLLRVDKGGNPDLVRESQRKRGGEKAVALVDQVIELDNEWKSARFNANEINKEINAISKKMAPLAKAKMMDSPEALALKEEKEKLNKLKDQLNKDADEKEIFLNSKLKLIGNIVHESVVDSNDEANNKMVRKWWPEGRTEVEEIARRENLIKDGKGVPGLYSHHEVLEKIGGYDPVRGIFFLTRRKGSWP